MTSPTIDEAVQAADAVLDKLLTSQPNFIAVPASNKNRGEDVAEYIEGIRNKLIEMYRKTPRQ